MTPPPSRRAALEFWLGLVLVLASVLGGVWLTDVLLDRAGDPSVPSMSGMDHGNMTDMDDPPPSSAP